VSSSHEPRNVPERSYPLISVVIPTYNVAEYLADCLESITRQDFHHIEIIAIDGASEDASVAILNDIGKGEPRLAIHPREKIGPGRARNEGAELATGEYVWFVDADDLVVADCLTFIAKRIEAVRPDVLFIDYQALYPNGRLRPGDRHDLMGREVPECFTLAEQPWVIDLNMASWNKVIRREFLRSVPAFWPYSPHEDIETSYSLLMEADKLSILNHVCYVYRKHRSGSEMESGRSNRHFNIFYPYEMLLDQIEKRGSDDGRAITPEIRQALFQRAIGHYASIFDAGGLGSDRSARRLIAHGDRRRFFARMHQDYLRYAPSGYQRPHGFRGIKFRLIEKNAYKKYSALEPLNKIRVWAVRFTRGVRRPLWRLKR